MKKIFENEDRVVYAAEVDLCKLEAIAKLMSTMFADAEDGRDGAFHLALAVRIAAPDTDSAVKMMGAACAAWDQEIHKLVTVKDRDTGRVVIVPRDEPDAEDAEDAEPARPSMAFDPGKPGTIN